MKNHPLTADTETLLEFYWKIMNDDEAKPSERMAAAKEFTKLKGLQSADVSKGTFTLHIHLQDENICKKS
jgi:hypothetical protein